jgi:hypothetical protein
MENKMKKLIALFAVSTLASTSAIAGVALSGSASVSYDDGGDTTVSSTTGLTTLTVTGTAGGTTVAAGFSLEGAAIATDSITMTSAIGPITVVADLFNEDKTAVAGTDDGDGDKIAATVNSNGQSVAVSLAAPIGDASIGLDNSGDITVTGTFSGVTIAHTIKDGSDSTTGSASIAGMDISLTNAAGASTWSIGTTVSGVALTLDSENDISATFGLTGNTMTVSHVGARAEIATDATNYSTAAVAAYTTVAVSRALTSGATIAATYSTLDDSLTLKASVAF